MVYFNTVSCVLFAQRQGIQELAEIFLLRI